MFLDEVRTALVADGAAFAVVDQAAQELRTVGWRGYENDVVEDWLNDPRTSFVPASRRTASAMAVPARSISVSTDTPAAITASSAARISAAVRTGWPSMPIMTASSYP